ncbi:hypothetical protein SMICM304S_00910 [Streptomyces microflavus]
MSPQLFADQLKRGAWGITAAVPHQARVYRAYGIGRIFLANELVDPVALRWLAGEMSADPEFRFICYVDSVRGVELMEEALSAAGATRPVDVVVELGAGEGARTGSRTEADCAAVADAVAAAGSLRLVGMAGYEGEVPDADPERVRAWLRRLVALAATFDAEKRFTGAEEIVISAGGSAWFDAVADVFAEVPELSSPVLKLLRSGAYVSHDDGHYKHLTPFNRVPEEGALEPAFRLWAQVVALTGEQAFLNAGKRDAAYDLDLPEAQVVRSARTPVCPATGITVTGLSDQHTWVRTEAGAELEVGVLGRHGPLAPVHQLRQVAADPAGGGGRPRSATTSARSSEQHPHVPLSSRSRHPLPSPAPERSPMDLVLRDALVVDGTGEPSYRADVAVDGGRIAEIHPKGSPGPAPPPPARSTPTASRWPPASSTCTPTAIWRCCATRTTAQRRRRASPSKSSARTACRTPRSTTVRSPRSAAPSPAGTATAPTSTSTGARSAAIWTGWTATSAARASPSTRPT